MLTGYYRRRVHPRGWEPTIGIADNFNRADTVSTLGTTSDGKATWTNCLSVGFHVASNQAQSLGATSRVAPAGAWIDTGASIGTFRVTTFDTHSEAGLLLRYQDDNNYVLFLSDGWDGGLARLISVTGGAYNLIAQWSWPQNPGDQLQAVIGPSNLYTLSINGSLLGTATFASFPSATKHGLYVGLASSGRTLDAWSGV